MRSPEFSAETRPSNGEPEQSPEVCLLVRIANVDRVLNGAFAPRPEARVQAIEAIEATMISRDADDNGAYRIACPVGGCAGACSITIPKLRFDEWSDQGCVHGESLPSHL